MRPFNKHIIIGKTNSATRKNMLCLRKNYKIPVLNAFPRTFVTATRGTVEVIANKCHQIEKFFSKTSVICLNSLIEFVLEIRCLFFDSAQGNGSPSVMIGVSDGKITQPVGDSQRNQCHQLEITK